MADGLHRKRLSLDTNVLLDLAAGYDFAIGFKTAFQKMGYSLHCAPGVLAELSALSEDEDETRKKLAAIVLENLIVWDILPINLTDVQKRFRTNFMNFVEDRGILPKGERNDARILADTAIEGIPLLVTSDSHLLGADKTDLALAFEDAGLIQVYTVSPRDLWKSGQRRKAR